MNPLETHQLIADESAAARQLRARFPWLRFERELEREFRRDQAKSRLGQVRINLKVGALLVIAFGLLNSLVLERQARAPMLVAVFGLLLPVIIAAIVVAQLPNARRLYPRVAPLLATVMGIIVAAIELRAAQAGVQLLFATVLLTSIYIYYLLGLLFYQALRANAIIWCAYVAFGVVGNLPESVLIYNALMLLFANVVGAVVGYGLEMVVRKHFLEARLLSEAAARDGLTGIYNRRRFDEHLETVWQQAQRDGVTVALLLADIDFFKRFNDHNGHQAGDECLRAVATALTRAARRPLDFVARYGGEEFAVILYDPSREYLQETATRIHTNVALLAIAHGESLVARQVTVSVGIAYVAPALSRSAQGFVQLADEALYQAKNEGRNRSVFSDVAYELLETGSFRGAGRAAVR